MSAILGPTQRVPDVSILQARRRMRASTAWDVLTHEELEGGMHAERCRCNPEALRWPSTWQGGHNDMERLLLPAILACRGHAWLM